MEDRFVWRGEKPAPVWAFLGWTFLINGIGSAISIAGERTGLLAGSVGQGVSMAAGTLVGGFSPLYATYLVLRRHGQIAGVRDFFRRVLHTPDKKKTVLITSLFCLALLLAAALAGERTGAPWFVLVAALPLMVLGGGVEEIGWRGFLQPALEKRMPFFPAVLVVSVIWFAWHVPLWFVPSSNQSGYDLLPFFLQLTVMAFVLAALHRATGSTAACVLYHAWGNAIGAVYQWDVFATFPISPILLLYDGIAIAASLVLVVHTARKDRNVVSESA